MDDFFDAMVLHWADPAPGPFPTDLVAPTRAPAETAFTKPDTGLDLLAHELAHVLQ
ncbi:MAG: hypothetical protein AAFR52_01900 [Pseudomonadota bacterium]